MIEKNILFKVLIGKQGDCADSFQQNDADIVNRNNKKTSLSNYFNYP